MYGEPRSLQQQACSDPAEPKAGHRAEVAALHGLILREEQRLYQAHPWLMRKNLIGALVFGGNIALLGALVALYLEGALPGWAAVPLVALPLSILHELEHDLIHHQYFRRSAWVQNLLFLVIWLAKLSIDPWLRRPLHLRHHRRSGQTDDIEERLIGLGTPFGLRRLALSLPVGGLLLAPSILRDVKRGRAEESARDQRRKDASAGPSAVTPRGTKTRPSAVLIAADAVVILGIPLAAFALTATGSAIGKAALVLWVLPNFLRHFCLALMSSYSHYYGDIPPNDVFVQNQILSHWCLWPFQLFCLGFGSTHIIHHYVVDQPFYVRQLIAPKVQKEMQRLGVPVNDSGVLRRANRRG